MRKKLLTFLKFSMTLLVVTWWCAEFMNYSIVGQVKAQDNQFVDPEQVFDQYMENFDREQTVLEKESNKQGTRESIAEDIAIAVNSELTVTTPVVPPTLP